MVSRKSIAIAGVAVIFAVVCLAVSCTNTEPYGTTNTGMASEKGPGGFDADYRTSRRFFTLIQGMKKGSSPHGTVQIWYSSNIKDIIGKSTFEVPEGTVAIKPFEKDGMPGIDGIAVMVKGQKGYDSENNDWYYEMRDADGKLMLKPKPGKIEMCIGCHAAARAKDYLAGTELR